jgi:hypothetical protein
LSLYMKISNHTSSFVFVVTILKPLKAEKHAWIKICSILALPAECKETDFRND